MNLGDPGLHRRDGVDGRHPYSSAGSGPSFGLGVFPPAPVLDDPALVQRGDPGVRGHLQARLGLAGDPCVFAAFVPIESGEGVGGAVGVGRDEASRPDAGVP